MAWGLGPFKVTKRREVTLKGPSPQAFRDGPLNITVYRGRDSMGARSCGLIRTRRLENRFSSNTAGSIDIVMIIGSSIRPEV